MITKINSGAKKSIAPLVGAGIAAVGGIANAISTHQTNKKSIAFQK